MQIRSWRRTFVSLILSKHLQTPLLCLLVATLPVMLDRVMSDWKHETLCVAAQICHSFTKHKKYDYSVRILKSKLSIGILMPIPYIYRHMHTVWVIIKYSAHAHMKSCLLVNRLLNTFSTNKKVSRIATVQKSLIPVEISHFCLYICARWMWKTDLRNLTLPWCEWNASAVI